MKHHLLKTLAATAPAMLFLAAALGMAGCTADDNFGRLPQGSIPLRVGDVTVSGMKTNTRVEENPTAGAGYTGIRKSGFVNGDVLTLTLSNDGGTITSLTATLTGGAWTLSEKAYIIPGTTGITAAYAATEQTAGIKPDALAATEYTLDGQKVSFAMKHTNAMIDITTGTLPAGVTIDGITLVANNGTADETLATVVETDRGDMDDTKHHRTIVLPGTVKSITAVINGMSYVATLAIPLTVEANKKYPVALTFKENKLTASVGAPALDWGMGGTTDVGLPSGYTRIIATPEDLAQLAQDVNDRTYGLSSQIIIQTTDLDMSKLMTAEEANLRYPGKNYTYTATAEQWVPIGVNSSYPFEAKYNGYGHTISNLKMSNSTTGCGLFGYIVNGTVTGVHLRDFTATEISGSGGAFAIAIRCSASGGISLCSATGSISMQSGKLGGFAGSMAGGYVTRCSADVDVTLEDASVSNSALSGFIGYAENMSYVIGCSSTGSVNWSTAGTQTAGFIGHVENSQIIGNYCGSTLKDATAVNAFIGTVSGNMAKGNYVTTVGANFSSGGTACADNAYAGATSMSGVTGDVTPATAYAALTANNVSLADVKTLHWSTAEGYTLTEVTEGWYVTDIWQDNGTAAPTIDLTYEGTPLYNDMKPNLLAIPGQTAYYVAPENASDGIAWSGIDFDTICPAGWHVPTLDDFMAMTGFPKDADFTYIDNNAAITAAFPEGSYWSSDRPWYLYNVYGEAGFKVDNSLLLGVRCVRAK